MGRYRIGSGQVDGFTLGHDPLGKCLQRSIRGIPTRSMGFRTAVFSITGITTLAIPVACFIRWPVESQRIISSKQPFGRDGGNL